ncbi:hypothetical protein JCM3770_001239 [Rhodotorula araucariae]
MSPLAHRQQAPRTPPRPRPRATRASVSIARSGPAPAPAAPKSLHARIDSSSPVPTGIDPASTGAHIKDTHDRWGDHPDQGADDARFESQTEGHARDRRFARAEPYALHRTEGTDKRTDSLDSGTLRSPLSKVVSSSRSSLAGLAQRPPTPAITPIASSPYVPPHLRQQLQDSAAKENNPLARFDRSACPEPEDSFYSHFSGAFSFDSLSPFSTPNTSFAYSPTPVAFAARAEASAMDLHLASSPPLPSLAPDLGSAPPSSVTFLSRQLYLDPLHHPHPRPILEDSEDDVARPPSARSWADEVDEAFPFEDAGALSPGEEQVLGYGDAESVSDVGIDLQIAVSLRRGSANTALSSPLGVPEDEVVEGVCTGCGAVKTDCFVALQPCGHPLCPVCMNALINATAHRPPRPTACFACASPIATFAPDTAFSETGTGLVAALMMTFERGQTQRRVSPLEAATLPADGSMAETRRRRRRSSVVAAAIATVLSTPSSSSRDASTPQAGSPTDTLRGAAGGTGDSPLARHSRRRSISLSSTPGESRHLYSRHTSDSSGELDTAPLIGEVPPSTAPDRLDRQRPLQQDVFLSCEGTTSTPTAPLFAERASVDWPVVRLDNVPWEVTVDEIEAWLPTDCLANDPVANVETGADGDDEEGGTRAGDGEGVTLAVHILCNRADGRTLNQAYVECSSRAAAHRIVRFRDGVRLRSRPVHITIANQAELLSTVFPTYRPGFDGIAPNTTTRVRGSPPIPLLVQTELTGLLNLCRLESAHAKKVPERPFFNIVTILEKMPWAYPESFNSTGIVRLFNTACAAIEILGTVKHTVAGWQDILAVLVDGILRCPVLRPTQKQKALRLAANLGFERHATSGNSCAHLMPFNSPSTGGGVLDAIVLPFRAPSLQESYVTTALDPMLIPAAAGWGDSGSARFEAVSATASSAVSVTASASTTSAPTEEKRRRRRLSSLVAQLGLEPAVIAAVANALDVTLVGSSRPDGEEEEKEEAL